MSASCVPLRIALCWRRGVMARARHRALPEKSRHKSCRSSWLCHFVLPIRDEQRGLWGAACCCC